jgi:hypothetical protein
MKITTIRELKDYMDKNCYNNNFYSIDGNVIFEGFGIDKFGELFIWYYTERGEKENLELFKTEREVVEYAYKIIKDDKFAKSHLIRYTNKISIKNDIVIELVKRKISYWVEEIPAAKEIFYRIFIEGCDINKAIDLIEKI